MSERDKKAYDLAAEVVKQILGLSTAIVGISATLLKTVLPVRLPLSVVVIVAAWTSLIISIVYGISTLRWLTTKMFGPDDVRLPSLADPDIVKSARVHIATFVTALILLALFGAIEIGGGVLGFSKAKDKSVAGSCRSCPK
jgi:hypothetical protein